MYQVAAGLMGCEVEVVVAEFLDPESAHAFAADFRIGKTFALMHGLEWVAYVREVHKWRNFSTATLAKLLSLGGIRN